MVVLSLIHILLYVLMFSVGISVGANKGVFQKLREHHVKILLIPTGVILGSIFGGVVCSLFLGESLRDSLMIVSGLGWYSLSGVLVTELAGAKLGTIAFLCNLLREIFSFMIIPVVVKYFNGYEMCIRDRCSGNGCESSSRIRTAKRKRAA